MCRPFRKNSPIGPGQNLSCYFHFSSMKYTWISFKTYLQDSEEYPAHSYAILLFKCTIPLRFARPFQASPLERLPSHWVKGKLNWPLITHTLEWKSISWADLVSHFPIPLVSFVYNVAFKSGSDFWVQKKLGRVKYFNENKKCNDHWQFAILEQFTIICCCIVSKIV